MPEPLLRPRDVAKRLGISISMVYRLAGQGILPAFTLPGTHALRFVPDRLEILIRRWAGNGFTPQRRNYPTQRAKRRPQATQP